MNEWYKEDLAYIHDVGFRDFAIKSAPGILRIFHRNKIHNALVVDLGCGSGLWARELAQAGYRVLGVDISESMLQIARQRVPDGEFRLGSLFTADIPPCGAVTSLGECLNYAFDPNNDQQALARLFERIYSGLLPGGVFVFDIVEPGQIPRGAITRAWTEGEDWVVLVEKEEDEEQTVLKRRIMTFRKFGEHYRRSDEVHHQWLFRSEDIANRLRSTGFDLRTLRSYGRYRLPKARVAFIARKPEVDRVNPV